MSRLHGSSIHGEGAITIDPEIAKAETVSFTTAVWLIFSSSVPIFITVLMIKITVMFSFDFLKNVPDVTVLSAFGVGTAFLNIFCYAIIYSLNIGLLTRMS
jgi:hypothetical protein